MFKTISIILLSVLYIGQALAFSNTVDLTKFTTQNLDEYNDIGYFHIIPQYEKNMDPKKTVSIEFFFGEIDESEASKKRLEFLKNEIAEDQKRDPNFRTNIFVSSNKDQIDFHKPIIDDLNFGKHRIEVDKVPEFMDYEKKLSQKRIPSSEIKILGKKIPAGRKFWTFIRFSAGAGGVFASFYMAEGLSATMAFSAAFWPGLFSGGITYYSNVFGEFLTSGKMSKWVLESDNYFTRNFRKMVNLTPLNFEKTVLKHKAGLFNYIIKKDPEILQKKDIKFLEKEARKIAKQDINDRKIKIERWTSRLKISEEYFKWYITEIAFTAFAFKLPQVALGLVESGSLLSMTGDVLTGSMMGFLAQGPGDIAIQKRKYQMIAELKKNIEAGKVNYPDYEKTVTSTEVKDGKKVKVTKTIRYTQESLIAEIDKILAPNSTSSIQEISHKALTKIENWARSRATFISIFSVAGVGLELVGAPMIARPMLLSLGAWGAAYYATVEGWIKIPKPISKNYKIAMDFITGKYGFRLQTWKTRYCSNKFIPVVP